MLFSWLKDFLVGIVGTVGYPGVFIAMVIESCLVPLPSEITMPLAGALAAEGEMNLYVAALVGAFGNLVGSLIAYWLGTLISEEAILKFIRRWGKWILVSEHEYQKTKKWIHDKGSFVAFFGRLIPGVRTVISLPAGVARIPLVPFSVWTFLGSLMWSYVLVYVGYQMGEHWEGLEVYFRKFEILIIAAGLALVGFYIYRKVTEDKRHR